MHDLRRQALESGKTVSRKARSKQSSTVGSKVNSAANSRAASRTVSRAGSDDEEGGNLSDETSFRFASSLSVCRETQEVDLWHSVNSIDEVIATSDDSDAAAEAWKSDLADRIEEIIDRKRSSVQGRETALGAYVRILTSRYAEEEIKGKEDDLVASFLRSIKAETSEKESILAMKGEKSTLWKIKDRY